MLIHPWVACHFTVPSSHLTIQWCWTITCNYRYLQCSLKSHQIVHVKSLVSLTYMYICVCLCVYVCVCMYVCACMCVHVCVCMYVCVCMCVHVCVCILACVSVRMCVYYQLNKLTVSITVGYSLLNGYHYNTITVLYCSVTWLDQLIIQ